MKGCTLKTDLLEMIARSVDFLDSTHFAKAIADLCLHITKLESAFICAFFADHKPLQLYSDLSEEEDRRTVVPYLNYAYLLDPFYDLFKQEVGDSVVPLVDCAPDGFRSSDYYRMFYADTGLLVECGVFITFGPEASIVISLGSRDEHVQMPSKAKQTLEAVLPIIASLCRRHWPRLKPTMIAGTGGIGSHLEQSFEMFGTSMLSAREAQIVRLILKGHSTKSIARILGSSPDTVKVHRKRIYAKMNIASQGELFSIFLAALSRTPPNSQEDPLVYTTNSKRL